MITRILLYQSRSPHFPKSKEHNCYLIFDADDENDEQPTLAVAPYDIEVARAIAKAVAPGATIEVGG